jgi:hypothetical protein
MTTEKERCTFVVLHRSRAVYVDAYEELPSDSLYDTTPPRLHDSGVVTPGTA